MEGVDIIRVKRSRSKGEEGIIKIKRTPKAKDTSHTILKDRKGGYDDLKRDVEDDNIPSFKFDDYEGDIDVNNSVDSDNNGAANDTNAGDEKKSVGDYTHGFYSVKGKMDHGMEDYVVAKKKEMDGHELGLYAIFDGHSGRDVAAYLQGHLFDNILSQLDFWKNPASAVKRAYRQTDDVILENIVGSRGGSTAVTAIIVDREKLIVANVGDSRAVVCRNGKAKPVTFDHEPLKEKDIVEGRGGFISHKPGNVPRVDGQLAMSRAFGDARLKDHITAEPDVMIQKIKDDTDFIILASDGLWKKISGNVEPGGVRLH